MRKIKYRLIAALLAVMCCMAAFSMTALVTDGGYYASNEDARETPPGSIDSITVSTEGVKLPANQGGKPLTPDGNLTLVDDIIQSEPYAGDEGVTAGDKQFITVQSKSGNYFYLVIDRSGNSENVYFLNLVDEADLLALMEDGDSKEVPTVCACKNKCAAGDVNTACPVCKTNMGKCVGKEAVPTTPKPEITTGSDPNTDSGADNKKSGGSSGLLFIALVLAFAGGGALYWFKFRKNKPQTKGPADLDDYDYGEDDDDEEYEIEDAPVVSEDKPDTEETDK